MLPAIRASSRSDYAFRTAVAISSTTDMTVAKNTVSRMLNFAIVIVIDNCMYSFGYFPKEYIQYSNHGESLKSRSNRQ
jgi:hypothetical protein